MIPTRKTSVAAVTALATTLSATLPALAADDVSLQLSWLAQGQASALFYGMQEGCFADQDINLTVLRGYGALDTVAKVSTGAAQFGQVDIGSLITSVARSDAPLRAVLPLFSDSPLTIGVLGSGPVETLLDMQGRILAAGPNEGGSLLLPAAMAELGGDADLIERQSIEPAALAGSLLQGRVDGIITYVTTAAGINAVAEQNGLSVRTLDFGRLLGIYGDVLVASNELLDTNPDLATRFAAGVRCAYTSAYENQEAAVQAMVDANSEMEFDRELMLARIGWGLVFDSSSPALEWDEERIAQSARITQQAQGLEELPAAETFIWMP